MARTLIVGLIALAAAARADEVHLVGGGRLHCEVLEQRGDGLLVRLPHGTMLIPAGRVERVVSEDSGAYLRREAKASLRSGATRSAVELLERALRERPGDAEARADLASALWARARALREEWRLVEASRAARRVLELDAGRTEATGFLHSAAVALDRRRRLHEAGREALAAGDSERALALLDAWRMMRPEGDAQARAELARAHVEAGAGCRERGGLREALDHFRCAVAFGAEDAAGESLRLLLPVAVLEALQHGRLDDARRAVGELDGSYPDPAVPPLLRGLVHQLAGEVEEASAAYADAARRARPDGGGAVGLTYAQVTKLAEAVLRSPAARKPARNAAEWREAFLGPLERYDGAGGFVTYAATTEMARSVGQAAESIHDDVAHALLGRAQEAPSVELVVHPSQRAYVAADLRPAGDPLDGITMGREQTRGVCYESEDEKGRPVVRIEVCADDPGLLTDSLPHEIVHLVQRHHLKVHGHAHWLDEGTATLFESRAGRRRRIEHLQASSPLLPVAELFTYRSTPPARAGLFYSQSHSVTAFLCASGDERDWRRFLEVSGDLGVEAGLARIYGYGSIDALERAWRKAIGRDRG